MEFETKQADIFEVEAEALVYLGNTQGELLGSQGERLRKLAGNTLEEETQDIAPIAVGAATVLEVEGLRSEVVIYAPLLHEEGEKIIVENVRRCTRASLVAASVKEMESIVMPVIHPNSDDMAITETIRAMIDELRAFRPDPPFTVTLVDEDIATVETVMRAQETVR